jgi:hypothetical protein
MIIFCFTRVSGRCHTANNSRAFLMAAGSPSRSIRIHRTRNSIAASRPARPTITAFLPLCFGSPTGTLALTAHCRHEDHFRTTTAPLGNPLPAQSKPKSSCRVCCRLLKPLSTAFDGTRRCEGYGQAGGSTSPGPGKIRLRLRPIGAPPVNRSWGWNPWRL